MARQVIRIHYSPLWVDNSKSNNSSQTIPRERLSVDFSSSNDRSSSRINRGLSSRFEKRRENRILYSFDEPVALGKIVRDGEGVYIYIYIGGWARARKSTTVRNSWRHQLRVEAPSTYFSTRETSAIVLRGAWIVLEYRASALQSICLFLLRVRPSYWSPHVPNTRERIRAED